VNEHACIIAAACSSYLGTLLHRILFSVVVVVVIFVTAAVSTISMMMGAVNGLSCVLSQYTHRAAMPWFKKGTLIRESSIAIATILIMISAALLTESSNFIVDISPLSCKTLVAFALVVAPLVRFPSFCCSSLPLRLTLMLMMMLVELALTRLAAVVELLILVELALSVCSLLLMEDADVLFMLSSSS